VGIRLLDGFLHPKVGRVIPTVLFVLSHEGFPPSTRPIPYPTLLPFYPRTVWVSIAGAKRQG
jgi:hypothetical protein